MAETELNGQSGKQAYIRWLGKPPPICIDIRQLLVALAGERLIDQPTKSYMAVRQEANASIISDDHGRDDGRRRTTIPISWGS